MADFKILAFHNPAETFKSQWEKNVRHGGGAFIPCPWKIECNEEYIGEVERKLSLVVSEMGEEGADMVVEVR